ncbi:MAG TPA: FKBP-type peptidyl-prolyl cis-trans isomerase [Terracidiphilus sp.]|jgi:peptidylprolyl isomerase|nr:FKBP-type peptidyl-prolyl cis-trans isomerase [Terracidiphilus sp.]
MNRLALLLSLSATLTLGAQTAPKPSAPAAKPSTSSTAAAHSATTATAYKLPPGEKRIPGIPKLAFAVHYQDIKVGTGVEAESGKLWHVKYKGWRAVDGVVFDSWDSNRRPEMKDGKPVTGPDGKPVMGEPQPLPFPQGTGRLIPGFDYGVTGMHVGGKRRIFIPWQAAYGTRTIPDRPDHPGIPAKSDLIFDVELVDVTDMPAQPQRPMMPRPMPGAPGAPAPGAPAPGQPGKPSTPPPAGQPATPPPSGAPATTPAPGSPTTPPASKPAPQSQPTPPPQPQ